MAWERLDAAEHQFALHSQVTRDEFPEAARGRHITQTPTRPPPTAMAGHGETGKTVGAETPAWGANAAALARAEWDSSPAPVAAEPLARSLWQVPQPLLPMQCRQPLPPKKVPQIQPTRFIPKRRLRARRQLERLQSTRVWAAGTLRQCDNKYGSST